MADRLTIYDECAHIGRGGIAHKQCREKCTTGMTCATCSLEEDMLKRLAAYEDLGPVEELAALKEAKDDGRLVTLPCKRGDTAYRLCGPKGRRRIVERPVTSVEFNGPVTIIHSTADDVLGKTVFLTRDEAEKALGKEQDER